MTEEKKKEPLSEEDPEHKDNIEVKTPDLINNANEAAVRLEDANKVFKEQLDRQERMKVEERLAGKTEAGTTQEKKEESPGDYAQRILAGKND